MRRPQDRSSGIQGGNQQGQSGQRAGATGSSATSGAADSGGRESVTRETVTRETPVSTTTTHERTIQQQPASASYQQRAQPSAGYGRQPSGGGGFGGFGTSNLFGGIFSTLAGLLTFFAGLGMVARHRFYHQVAGYAYNWNIPSWGWVLVALGILLFASGASHLLRLPFSRVLCMVLAVLTIIAGFMVLTLGGLLIWGIIIAAIGALALRGLIHGAEQQSREQHEHEMEQHGGQWGSQYGQGQYGQQQYGGAEYGRTQEYSGRYGQR